MSFQPEPRAKRQRTTFLDNGKPDLNPAAPSQPDISSSRRPVHQQHPTSTAGPLSRAHEGPIRKRERVAVNGNYIGYYRRRREVQHGELDDRLELVPKEWIRGKRVLDVGANAGEVSIELAQRFRAAEVVGVDIDPELTQQARRNGEPLFLCGRLPALRLTPIRLLLVDLAWSRQAPIPRLTEDAKRLRRGEATSMAEDPFESAADLTVEDSAYFPTSMARMFGFLPHPRGLVRSYTESNAVSPRRSRRDPNYIEHLFFPENIVFETADWVNTPLQADREGYDIIFAYVFPSLPRSRWARADSEPFATPAASP
jgi:7SK snRNA methylphosphate capping enzyme